MPLLRLDSVCKRYGSLQVVDTLSIEVEKDDALGVIGPNGAGKTTMFNLINGNVRPDSGTIHFAGMPIERLDAAARCRAGIGRTYQLPNPFGDMTVFENVLVGAVFGAGLREQKAHGRSIEALERTGLVDRANTQASKLRLLDRKRMELARALATQPSLLLLDEIAGGLTEGEVQHLIETIRAIRAAGVTLVWVEHIMHALLSVVDRLMVMDSGLLLTQGPPKEVLASEEVKAVYMGIDPGDEEIA
jgi:branched-chain amino acid transport system ATP-binding protein